jgi:hypothetical protein
MGRGSNRLTAIEINRKKRPGLYADGGGLCLQVQPGTSKTSSPTKAWIFRYMLSGQPHKMGMGPLALVSLAEAREKALTYRKQLLAGIDPLAARAAERSAASPSANVPRNISLPTAPAGRTQSTLGSGNRPSNPT